MRQQPFKGCFTQQEPIAEDAIATAMTVLRSGRLHRYNTPSDAVSVVSDDAPRLMFMAKAITPSGSYMLSERHGSAPDRNGFDELWPETLHLSGRPVSDCEQVGGIIPFGLSRMRHPQEDD